MSKYKLTTNVRATTMDIIRELAGKREIGRFLDELVERAQREGWFAEEVTTK